MSYIRSPISHQLLHVNIFACSSLSKRPWTVLFAAVAFYNSAFRSKTVAWMLKNTFIWHMCWHHFPYCKVIWNFSKSYPNPVPWLTLPPPSLSSLFCNNGSCQYMEQFTLLHYCCQFYIDVLGLFKKTRDTIASSFQRQITPEIAGFSFLRKTPHRRQ